MRTNISGRKDHLKKEVAKSLRNTLSYGSEQ